MMYKHTGFTLMELMIVVAIIAILTSFAMPAYQSYVIRSQLTAGLADINAGRSLFESHLVAYSVTSYDVATIGLAASTARCSTITLEPGATGHIECTLNGHPLIRDKALRISRDEDAQWSCILPEGTPEQHRPTHCY